MAASSGMNNLTTLIKRLEAATSRLEDIASSSATLETSAEAAATTSSDHLSNASSVNGDSVPSRATATTSTQPQSAPTTTPLSPSITNFDRIINDELKTFSDISEKLGGAIADQAASFCTAFKAQRNVLLISTKAKEPSQTSTAYMDMLKDLQKGMETVNDMRDKNRKTPTENHLSMVADGVGMLAWVTIKPSPDKYVAEVLGGAQFYGNKVLTAFKDKGTEDVDWVKAFVKLCGSLIQYIKQHYPGGLEWNDTGVDIDEAMKEVKSGPSSSTSNAAPPPPPPPPLPQFDNPPPAPSNTYHSPPGGDMGAVFNEINKGESVTAGLRKVDKSEMTHKNPTLRADSSIPGRSDSTSSSGRGKSPTPPLKKKPESMRVRKPPRKELDGNKWYIENYESEQTPIQVDAERQQSLLISRCKSAVIKINGKANAISIDNCTKLDLLVDSLVSSVEVINTSNFRMQVLGTLPSVQLDKVDVGTVFLSHESLDAEIYTSKCTSINITLPPPTEDEDSTECPVPEQIKTTIVDGKLVNEIVMQDG